jgi:predicted dehydrogenase
MASTRHVKAYMNNPHTKVVAVSSRKEEGAKKLAAIMPQKEGKPIKLPLI